MSDYRDMTKKEAKEFYDSIREEFQADTEEFGGKSERPNLMRWLDRNEALAKRVAKLSEKWGNREFRWVQTHTRNPEPKGGDARSNAFASVLKDIRFEIKKLAKG